MSTRQTYDQELLCLQQDLLKMGSIVEEAIHNAVQSLAAQDPNLAQRVIDGDDKIDWLQISIEDRCMKLIATQQPLAKDLRIIGTGIKIVTDLERIADHACDIAHTTIKLSNQPLIKPLIDIPKMAFWAQTMLKESLDAYVNLDMHLAKQICQNDDEVDELFNQVFHDLLEYMIADPTTIQQATQLIFVARYLERIADHATNLAENIIYLISGQHPVANPL